MSSRWGVAKRCASAVLVAGTALAGSASATFIVQSGGNTVLDTTTNLIWERNATNLGPTTWQSAALYANSLVVDGQTGWRLPELSEAEDLYHDLRDSFGVACCGDVGEFKVIRPFYIWTNTEVVGLPQLRWMFNFDGTLSEPDFIDTLGAPHRAWFVRSATAAVSEPQTVALLLTGLGLLGWLIKRR